MHSENRLSPREWFFAHAPKHPPVRERGLRGGKAQEASWEHHGLLQRRCTKGSHHSADGQVHVVRPKAQQLTPACCSLKGGQALVPYTPSQLGLWRCSQNLNRKSPFFWIWRRSPLNPRQKKQVGWRWSWVSLNRGLIHITYRPTALFIDGQAVATPTDQVNTTCTPNLATFYPKWTLFRNICVIL